MYSLSFAVSLQETSFEAIEKLGKDFLLLLNLYGFHGVEFAIRDPEKVDLSSINPLLEKLDLKVSAIGTGQAFVDEGLSLSSPDPEIRRKAVARLESHMKLSRELPGNPYIIVGLIRGKSEGNIQKAMKTLTSSMLEVLELAEKHEVNILIEPINRYETDLINTVPEAIKWIKDLGSERLFILADTFHMNIEERNIFESLRLAVAHHLLRYVHIADSNRWAPGYGHLDLERIVNELLKLGYSWWFSGEMLPKPSLEECVYRMVRELFWEES